MSVIREASADERSPHTLVIETCPCGSIYWSGLRRDPVVWAAWAAVHIPHGLQERP